MMVQTPEASPLSSISSLSSSSVFSEEGDAIVARACGTNTDIMQEENVIEISTSSSSEDRLSMEDLTESESDILDNLQEIQKSFDSNLRKLNNRIKRRKKLKEQNTRKREKTENSEGVPSNQGHSSNIGQALAAPFVLKESNNREGDYKRKLELVTKQLECCRLELMKKQRRSKAREPVVIEVPDDIEFYTMKTDCMTPAQNYWIQRRVREFFPQVLEIMCGNSSENSVSSRNHLTAQDLLVCRQVSKSWKNSVEKFLQEASLQLNDERSLAICTSLCFNDHAKYLSIVNSLTKDKLLKVECPFPSKDLAVSHFFKIGDSNSKVVIDSVNKILRKYGTLLQSFTFCGIMDTTSGYSSDAEILNCWNEVKRWLKKTPNLKALELSFPPSSIKIFKCDRFPAFKFLETVKCCHIPRSLVDSMLRRNPQIQNLILVPIPEEEDLPWGEYTQLNRISKVCLDISKVSRVEALRVVRWPLKKLVLSNCAMIREEPIPLKELFQTLMFFQKTLTDLSLDFRVISCPDIVLSLELPYLQNLSLSLRDSSWGRDLSYDFLLPLKALKTLKIIMEGEVDASQPISEVNSVIQVIQIKGYLNKLYESNLWKLFPNLEKVDVTAYYGREDTPKHFKYARDRLRF